MFLKVLPFGIIAWQFNIQKLGDLKMFMASGYFPHTDPKVAGRYIHSTWTGLQDKKLLWEITHSHSVKVREKWGTTHSLVQMPLLMCIMFEGMFLNKLFCYLLYSGICTNRESSDHCYFSTPSVV